VWPPGLSSYYTAKPCRLSMSTVLCEVPLRKSSLPVANQTSLSPRFSSALESASWCYVSQLGPGVANGPVPSMPKIPELKTPT
jgi:hypothetical protein